MRTLLFASFVAVSALPAQGVWTKLNPKTSPPVRSGHGLAFQLVGAKTLLFGGVGQRGSLNDTWEWSAGNWTRRTPKTSPSPRQQFAMSYDLRRRVVVLYGGAYFDDTWEWNGNDWTQRVVTPNPGKRCCHFMAYDIKRGKTVLFGGYDGRFRNDTWEWDGTRWTKLAPKNSPSARCCASMVYDSARGVCVLFGGGVGAADSNETWEWNGVDWTKRTPPLSPSARRSSQMAYDTARARTVLFGGGTGSGGSTRFNDTWEWDGETWTERKPTTRPSVRFIHAVGAGLANQPVMLFGGLTTGNARQGDTWVYSTKNDATFSGYGAGCRGSAGVPKLSNIGLPWIGQRMTIQLSSLPSKGAAALLFGGSRTKWGPFTLPLKLDGIGATGCSLFASPDLLFPGAVSGGRVGFTLVIPGVPALTGVNFYTQGFALDATANRFGATLSNAGAARIGRP